MVQHSVGLRAEPGTVLVANGHCDEECQKAANLEVLTHVQAPVSWVAHQDFYLYRTLGPPSHPESVERLLRRHMACTGGGLPVGCSETALALGGQACLWGGQEETGGARGMICCYLGTWYRQMALGDML